MHHMLNNLLFDGIGGVAQETSSLLSADGYPEVMHGSVVLKGLGMPDPEVSS